MKNSIILILLILSTQACNTASKQEAESEKQPKKPNIIFIIADDLNDAVGVYGGHPQVVTPHMDKMAEMGTMFTNAYANSPICGPSRASLLSGLHAKTTGYFGFNFVEYHWKNNATLAAAPNFVQHLRDNGYKTLGTGKIHHNCQEDWSVWDEFGIKPSWGPWPWDGTSDPAYEHGQLSQWRNSVVHPDMPENFGIDDQFGSIANVPHVKPDPDNDIPGHKGWRLFFEPFQYNGRNDRDLMPDELNAKWAKEKLQEEHEKPFLMCVGINRPHSPMFAPEAFFDAYPLDSIQLAIAKEGDTEDVSEALLYHSHTKTYGIDKYNKVIEAGGKEMLKKWTQAYLANVSFADAQIGKVIDAVQASKYKDNTYIVLTSDHGYHMGEKELLFKYTLWDKGSKVPFIVLGPDVIAGKKEDHPISLIDIFPTFLDWSGTASDSLELDGNSIRPFLEENPASTWQGDDFALLALASDTRLADGEPGALEDQHYGIVTDRYRYSRANNGEEEFYDHASDPHEWNNLIKSDEHSEIVEKMRTKLKNKVFGEPLLN